MGEPILVTASLPVREFGTTELRRLAGDLWDTMEREGGCGLAAPQIGVNLRVICFGFKSKNPLREGRSIPQTVLDNGKSSLKHVDLFAQVFAQKFLRAVFFAALDGLQQFALLTRDIEEELRIVLGQR